jgi:hypothetical protein
MERTQLFDLMGELKLFGMKAAFDEIMATAVKRQHEPQRIVGEPRQRSPDNPRSRRLRNPDQLRRRERYRPNPSFKRVKIGRRSRVKFGSRLTAEVLAAHTTVQNGELLPWETADQFFGKAARIGGGRRAGAYAIGRR